MDRNTNMCRHIGKYIFYLSIPIDKSVNLSTYWTKAWKKFFSGGENITKEKMKYFPLGVVLLFVTRPILSLFILKKMPLMK